MNITKRTHIAVLLLASFMFTACATSTPEVAEEVAAKVWGTSVQKGFSRDIVATAQVRAEKSTSISVKSKVTVEEILVSVGDTVRNGDVLMRLSSDEVVSEYEAARVAFENAQQQLVASEAAAAASVASAQVSVNNASSSLSNTQTQSASSANLSVNSAQKAYEQAQKNLELVKLQNTENYDKAVNTAKAQYDQALLQLDNIVAQNQALESQALEQFESSKLAQELSAASGASSLEAAENSYNKTLELAKSSEAAAQIGYNTSIETAKTSVSSAVVVMDEILGVSDAYKAMNDAYEVNLGVLDPVTKRHSDLALLKVYEALGRYTAGFDSAKALLELTKDALSKTSNMLDNSWPSNVYTQSQLNAQKNAVYAQQNAISAKLTELTQAKVNIDRTLATNASSVASAQNALIQAQNQLSQATGTKGSNVAQSIETALATYDATLKQLRNAESSARQQVEVARIAFDDTKALTLAQMKASEEQAQLQLELTKQNFDDTKALTQAQSALSTNSASNQLAQAQASLTSAQQNSQLNVLQARTALASAKRAFELADQKFQELSVTASFDGTITKIAVQLGEEVSANASLLTLENQTRMKVSAAVTADQAADMAFGNVVLIDNRYETTISAVSEGPDPVTQKFAVDMFLTDTELRSGDFVDLSITVTAQGEDAERLFVPISSVHVVASGSYVWIAQDSRLAKRVVDLGLIAGGYVEIITGLQEGEMLLTEGARLFEDKDEGRLLEVEVVTE